MYKKNGVFQIINDKTYDKKDLEDFISKITTHRWSLGEVLYKFFIIENYQEPGKPKQSIKVFLMHHVLTDGLGIFLSLGLLFTDKYEKDAFIQTGQAMSIWKKVFTWMLSPIILL